MKLTTAAVIVAAGSGSRFGGPCPKVFVPVAGVPLLAWSLRAFADHPEIASLCVVVAPPYLETARDICRREECGKPLLVVPGGAQRRESVYNGLQAVAEFTPDMVAIHDGARPLVSGRVISEALQTCRRNGAAIAAVAVKDTIKQTGDEFRIKATVPREDLYCAQTPQVFRFAQIMGAHERARAENWEVTDDAALLERLGHPVFLSTGDPYNIKVTVPEDLALVQWRLGENCSMRIGHGFDLHRLVEGRPLVLGGIHIPHSRGLLGHSDADAALHAIADALLGAVGEGDIGRHFPDTDPKYAGADSSELLRRVVQLVADKGWRIVNVDVTVLAQEPRLAPHIEAMRTKTAAVLQTTTGQVSYKATTTERLGPIGEGQAIAAEAVVLLTVAPADDTTHPEGVVV